MPEIQLISAKTGMVVGTFWEDDPALPAPQPLTLEDYRRAVQAHIEATAIARRYDSAASCASYVASTNPAWAAEAQAFVAWRDLVWTQIYAAEAEHDPVVAPPTIEALISSLPVIDWP